MLLLPLDIKQRFSVQRFLKLKNAKQEKETMKEQAFKDIALLMSKKYLYSHYK